MTDGDFELLASSYAGQPPGYLMIDPIAASGTTLRAAANLGRRATGTAINPKYRQPIRRRIAQAMSPAEGQP